MRMKFSMLAVTVFLWNSGIASAHPGHSPADVAAQVSQPFAGADHLAAFIALTSVLLMALRAVLKGRTEKTALLRK